jgi:peptidoglycan/LPS O-acetylase OafA/YrhL
MTTHFFHPKYRPDIDGLRAIAVLSVVAFHAFPNWVTGGFIGVDIFFVISGYLITSIIFQNLDSGTFSIGEFYLRRIRRIFPALLLVLFIGYVLGWLILFTAEYEQLGKHIVGGAGFISNLILWNESGYFDSSAEKKPFLHLWSLGVEEQFYIVFPILISISWKRKFNLLSIIFIISILSFYLNLREVNVNPIAAFYSPLTRFWELMCGGLLAWTMLYNNKVIQIFNKELDKFLCVVIYREQIALDGKTLRDVASFLGLLLLLYGFLRIGKDLTFPGKWALVPVLGAMLIISSGKNSWVNKIILSNRVLVWFGLISFPLYLWHWLILSFARIVEGETPSREIRIACVLASILLAWVTYKFVERPIRNGANNTYKAPVLLLLMVVIGGLGYVTYRQKGIPERDIVQKYFSYSESIKRTSRLEECFEIPYGYKKEGNWFCNLGDTKNPTAFFAYGDSHALSMVPALELFSKENNINIQFTGTSGCPSLLGIQSMRGVSGIEKYNCQALNDRIFEYVKNSKIKTVILINRWVYYTGSEARPSEINLISKNPGETVSKESSVSDFEWAVKNTADKWASIGVKVVFIEDNPQQLYDPKDVLPKGRALEGNYMKYSIELKEHVKNQSLVNSIIRKQTANVINFDDVLCPNNRCPLALNSRFIYFDDDHLSVEGSNLVYPRLKVELSSFLN